MAPTKPKRPSSTRPTFASSKKDKRTIKHSALLSRIAKSSTTASSKRLHRRRTPKTLITTLESLTDALPVIDETKIEGARSGAVGIGKKSLKSRPGAMRRKERVEKMERERFERNMAQMVGMEGSKGAGEGGGGGDGETGTGTGARWKALRGFIQQTLETRPHAKTG